MSERLTAARLAEIEAGNREDLKLMNDKKARGGASPVGSFTTLQIAPWMQWPTSSPNSEKSRAKGTRRWSTR